MNRRRVLLAIAGLLAGACVGGLACGGFACPDPPTIGRYEAKSGAEPDYALQLTASAVTETFTHNDAPYVIEYEIIP